MRKKTLTILLAIALMNIVLFGLWYGAMAADIHWGYAGDQGPAFWGSLATEYALCADGLAQSPIDIRDASALDLIAIQFHYSETTNQIVNNGHTIQVDVAAGSHIVYNGITFELLQFHFHSPSEHTIRGEAAPMEVHFVHRDPNSGALAVVGVMLTQGEAGNEAYAAVFDAMPTEAGEPQAMSAPLELEALLPETRAYYTYQGSLTTPPCSEIVRWLLLDTPVELSAAQIAAFTAIYAGNARPVQPLGAAGSAARYWLVGLRRLGAAVANDKLAGH